MARAAQASARGHLSNSQSIPRRAACPTRQPPLPGPCTASCASGRNYSPFPPTGYRQLDVRSSFVDAYIGITPATAMRLPDIGSQYLLATTDADKAYLDGAKTYKVTLPKGIPENNFWSFTVYDTMTGSMLDTRSATPAPARRAIRRRPPRLPRTAAPRSGSRPSGRRASPAATDSRPIPRRAGGRSCASTARSSPFVDKSWRPGEIEPAG